MSTTKLFVKVEAKEEEEKRPLSVEGGERRRKREREKIDWEKSEIYKSILSFKPIPSPSDIYTDIEVAYIYDLLKKHLPSSDFPPLDHPIFPKAFLTLRYYL